MKYIRAVITTRFVVNVVKECFVIALKEYFTLDTRMILT